MSFFRRALAGLPGLPPASSGGGTNASFLLQPPAPFPGKFLMSTFNGWSPGGGNGGGAHAHFDSLPGALGANLIIHQGMRTAQELTDWGNPQVLERWSIDSAVDSALCTFLNGTITKCLTGQQIVFNHRTIGPTEGDQAWSCQFEFRAGPEWVGDKSVYAPGSNGNNKFVRSDQANAGAAVFHVFNWLEYGVAGRDYAAIPVCRWDGWAGRCRWPLSPTDPNDDHPLWTGTDSELRMFTTNPNFDRQWSQDCLHDSTLKNSYMAADHLANPPNSPFLIRDKWIRVTATHDYSDPVKRRYTVIASDEDNDPVYVTSAKDEGGGLGVDLRSSAALPDDQIATNATRWEWDQSTSGTVTGVPTGLRTWLRNMVIATVPIPHGGRPISSGS